jgi:hypothetical protein
LNSESNSNIVIHDLFQGNPTTLRGKQVNNPTRAGSNLVSALKILNPKSVDYFEQGK